MPNTVDYRTLRRDYEAKYGRQCTLTSQQITDLWASTRTRPGTTGRPTGGCVTMAILAERVAETLPLMHAAMNPEPLRNVVLDVDGTKWLVREAKSHTAAVNEIAHARVTGSVGSKTTRDETRVGGVEYVVADVHRLNDDGTEMQPS